MSIPLRQAVLVRSVSATQLFQGTLILVHDAPPSAAKSMAEIEALERSFIGLFSLAT